MKVEIIGIFCLLTILVVGFVKGQSCDRRSDGCSDPTNGPFKQRFKPSCDKHDVCYSCGQRYGVDKARCDQTFYNNMKQYCSSVSSSERQECNEQAYKYYIGVKLFGGIYYEEPAESWCNQAWVRPCI
ncbi:hypothetical protein SNE40_020605 [Patella caerulea]|uniref:Uncharacterized protein n=1 Tax=Patella caerulea TaxID=87958 RepID=A0AAN8J5I2_PATCE